MADLVKIRRIKGDTVCVVDADKAERLLATPQWEAVQDAKPARAPRAPKVDADPVPDPSDD